MKIATILVRSLVGLAFTFFGLNILFMFLPVPPLQGHAAEFNNALGATGYMKVIGVCQLIGGLLLLSGKFVPLGLTLLGPVVVNILCYHIFIDRSGLPVALVVAVLVLFLLWRYRANFAGLVKP